jgi:hypothetical protein
MPSALARPVLHTLHLLTFAILLGTGVLLLSPELRAAFTGGYSLLIRRIHLWGGVAFAVLPAMVIFPLGMRNVFVAPAERTARTLWQGSHLVITILVGALFTGTGFAIWEEGLVSESLADLSRSTHNWLTYVAAGLVGLHLVEVGLTALVTRARTAGSAESPH